MKGLATGSRRRSQYEALAIEHFEFAQALLARNDDTMAGVGLALVDTSLRAAEVALLMAREIGLEG